MEDDPTLTSALRAVLDGAPLEQRDGAIVSLAYLYARRIDGGEDLHRLGPQYVATLDALRLTPRSRATGKGGAPDEQRPVSPTDQLRQRRATRQDPAAAVDPAAG